MSMHDAVFRPDPATAGPARAHTVRIAGGESTFSCEAGDVLLRAALRQGLGVPHECNVGGCGTCRYELLEGEVDTVWAQAPGLSERDRQKGRRLACQSRPRTDCTIKLRLMPQYQPVVTPARTMATLLERRPVTHDIVEFRFRLEEDAGFVPGQYALLELPGVDGARAYSMSNTANAGREWHFIVRRVPGGQGSGALFDRIRAGDRIGLDGPYGQAYLRQDSPRNVVCIAGGSGLAPMLSVARGMHDAGMLAGRSLDFFFGGRGPADIAGRQEVESLGNQGDVRFHPAISHPQPGDPPWEGYVGWIHEHMAEVLGERLAASEFYFAGPAPMAEAVLAMLVQAGVPASQMHYDRYF